MGKITYLRSLIITIMLMNLSLINCNNNYNIIIVEETTSVYSNYPKGGPPTDKVIAIMEKGETAEIIHARYAKDCEYLKIRLKDGRKGYVGWDGKYKVVSRETPCLKGK